MEVLSNYVDTNHVHYTEECAYIDECKVLRNFQGFKKGDVVNVSIELISWNVYINERKIHFGIHENVYNDLFTYESQRIPCDLGIELYANVMLLSDVTQNFTAGTKFEHANVTDSNVEFINSGKIVFSMNIFEN